jgi:hypothetical protein
LNRSVYPGWDASLADGYLRRFGIDPRATAATLSKGQRRAAGLVAAIAHRPRLLILDEPAGGLDPAMRREFLDAVISLIADGGGTVVFSSHHVAELERVATHVALLEDGLIAYQASVEECVEGHCLVRIPVSALKTPEVQAFLRSLPPDLWTHDSPPVDPCEARLDNPYMESMTEMAATDPIQRLGLWLDAKGVRNVAGEGMLVLPIPPATATERFGRITAFTPSAIEPVGLEDIFVARMGVQA